MRPSEYRLPFIVAIVSIVIVCVAWTITPFVIKGLYANLAERGQFGDLYGAINALFSGLAFAGVIVTILLQSRELALQREELAATRTELARAATAQEETLKAATESAKAAAATAKALVDNDRPWVGPMTVANKPLQPDRILDAWVIIQNTGRSAAREMRVAFEGHILPDGQIPQRPEVAQMAPKALFSSAPDHYPVVFIGGRDLSHAEFEELENGTLIAWIIGRVEYFDIRNDRRFTNVCARWDRHRRVFVPHNDGNDAD
jgi:hypothetical protein